MNLEIERRQEEIKLVCKHEVGHYIIAKEMQIETTGVAVKFFRGSGHHGYNTVKLFNVGLDSIEKTKVFLQKRVKILYAGVIAESTDIEGNYDEDYAVEQWTQRGGQMDYANIRELVRLLRDLTYPETNEEEAIQKELELISNELMNDVGNIVISRIELIHGVASSLAEMVEDTEIEYSLPEDELKAVRGIAELYGRSDDAPPTTEID